MQLCGKCKSDRVSEPHYFCSQACLVHGWPVHKLWHKQVSDQYKKIIDSATSMATARLTNDAHGLRPFPGPVRPLSQPDVAYWLQREGYAAYTGNNLKTAMKYAKTLLEYNPFDGHKLIGIIKFSTNDRMSSAQHYEAAMQSVPCGTEAWAEALSCSVEQRRLMYPCAVLCCPCTNCSAVTEPLPVWMMPEQLKLLAEKMPVSTVLNRNVRKATFHALANAFDNLRDPTQAAACYAHASMLCDADDPEKIRLNEAIDMCNRELARSACDGL